MPASSPKALTESSLIRFAGVGLVSTIIDFIVLNATLKLGGGIYLAGALGFFAGFSNGYYFNSRYVFRTASHIRYVKYLLVSVGAFLLTELFLYLFHVRGGLSENMAKLIAVAIVFFWNYGLSKAWVFSGAEEA